MENLITPHEVSREHMDYIKPFDLYVNRGEMEVALGCTFTDNTWDFCLRTEFGLFRDVEGRMHMLSDFHTAAFRIGDRSHRDARTPAENAAREREAFDYHSLDRWQEFEFGDGVLALFMERHPDQWRAFTQTKEVQDMFDAAEAEAWERTQVTTDDVQTEEEAADAERAIHAKLLKRNQSRT